MSSLVDRLARAFGWVRTSALLCLACYFANPALAAASPLEAFFEASEQFEVLSAQVMAAMQDERCEGLCRF